MSGQVDSEGKKLYTNSDSDGRYHSNWLNMMYPRLRLARNLLKYDGVIFISIDDNEVENLKKIATEIYGEENFVANIIWERSFSPVNLKKHFSENHDYIIYFSENLNSLVCNALNQTEFSNDRYKNLDNDVRGLWMSSDMTVGPVILEKRYEISTPSGKRIFPTSGRCWLFTKERYEEMLKDNRIWFGKDGSNTPRVKKFYPKLKLELLLLLFGNTQR